MSRKVIGVDLGGTKLLAGVIDEQLEVHDRVHRVVAGLSEEAVTEAIVESAAELIKRNPDVEAVGFGIPCLIDQRDGHAVMCVNLPLADVPFRDVMSERLGIPVFIDNDGNVTTLVETRFGAARGARDVVGLTIGTGIGGGLVLDGKRLPRPRRAAAPSSATWSSTTTARAARATARTTAAWRPSPPAMRSAARDWRRPSRSPTPSSGRAAATGEVITGELVTQLALGGDEVSRMVLGQIGRMLGVGLANFVNIFNPEVIVVGGGAMAAGDLLLEPAREEMKARALPPNRDQVKVVAARFGDEAGMLGAGVLALDELGVLATDEV